jgi:sterol desaturase/sphingolipid hydroxylase (fatty acid hydroxylase superfamily)
MSLFMQLVSRFHKNPAAHGTVVSAVSERLFPTVERKTVKEWGFNLSVSVLYVTVGAIAAVVGDFLGEKLRAGLHGSLINLKIGKTGGVARDSAATLLSLLIFDFFYYWWHRSEHKHPGHWAIHKLHHLDPGTQRVYEFSPSLARGCGTHSHDHDPDGHLVLALTAGRGPGRVRNDRDVC